MRTIKTVAEDYRGFGLVINQAPDAWHVHLCPRRVEMLEAALPLVRDSERDNALKKAREAVDELLARSVIFEQP